MKAVFFFIVTGAFLASCSSAWSAAELASRKQGCTADLTSQIRDAEASQAICSCWIDSVTAKYSPSDIDGEPSVSVQTDLDDMFRSCGERNGWKDLLLIVRPLKARLGARLPVTRSLAEDRDGTHGLSGGLRKTLQKVRPLLPAEKLAVRMDIPEVHLTAEGFSPLRHGTLQVFFTVKNGAEVPRFYSFKKLFEGNKKEFELTDPAHPNAKVKIEILSYEPLEYSLNVLVDGESVEYKRYSLPWKQEETATSLADSHPAKPALDALAQDKAPGTKSDSVLGFFDSIDGKPARVSLQFENEKYVSDDKLKLTFREWNRPTLSVRFGDNEKGRLDLSTQRGEGKALYTSEPVSMKAQYLEGTLPSGGPKVSVEFLDAEGKPLGVTREFLFGKEKDR